MRKTENVCDVTEWVTVTCYIQVKGSVNKVK